MKTNMKTKETVLAYQYDVEVYEGAMDAIHGGGNTIKEIFIPCHGIIINESGGLFYSEEARNVNFSILGGPGVEAPLKMIELPLELFEKIEELAKLRFAIKEKENETLVKLEEFWRKAS